MWKSWNWEAPPKQALPNKGYVAFENDQPIAACFLYADSDSTFAFLGWTITEQSCSKLLRAKACLSVVKDTTELAKRMGKDLVIAYTQNPALVDMYKKLGMQEMEHNVTTLAVSFSDIDLEMLKDE